MFFECPFDAQYVNLVIADLSEHCSPCQCILYTSVKVGHSRTSVYFQVWYGIHLRTVTTTFYLQQSIKSLQVPQVFWL